LDVILSLSFIFIIIWFLWIDELTKILILIQVYSSIYISTILNIYILIIFPLIWINIKL